MVFLGGGGAFSAAALGAVAAAGRVSAVIQAAPRRAGWRRKLALLARAAGLRAPDPLASLAASLRIPVVQTRTAHDEVVGETIRTERPDLLVSAGYRWLLPPGIYEAPPLGAINLHASLLPRHRGILPLFWIYHRDDRRTGVTVHRIASGADTGDILGQEAFDLPRGHPVGRLNEQNARRGAALLGAVVAGIRSVPARAQDPSLATTAPWVRPGTPMVDFSSWDVERVWHFLAGLWPHFREPLADDAGNPVRHGAVLGYRMTVPAGRPGTVRSRADGRLALSCRDGEIDLAPEGWRARVRRMSGA